ncbi:hypothetical protein BDZ97DRAFT_1763409 [Flammula alnicola]|nr:hypothetical protein BDZ97DRAFT_1763409 [Flammula alnicola]
MSAHQFFCNCAQLYGDDVSGGGGGLGSTEQPVPENVRDNEHGNESDTDSDIYVRVRIDIIKIVSPSNPNRGFIISMGQKYSYSSQNVLRVGVDFACHTQALPTSRLTRSMSSIMQISDTEQSQSPHPAVSRSRKEEKQPLSKSSREREYGPRKMLMRSAHASSIELSASLMPSVTSTRSSGVSTSPSNTAGGSLSSLAATCSSPPLTTTPISASLKPSVEIETIDAAQAATTPVLSQVPQGMTDAAPMANAVLANTAPAYAAPMANAVLANTAPAINAVPADAAPAMNAAVADTAPAVTTAVKTLGVPVGPTKSSDSSSQPQVKLVNQRLPRRHAKEVTGIAAETQNDNDGSAAAAGNASGNIASTSTSATVGFKKLTQSNAPKNLYYQEYLKEHPAITPAAFEMHWKGLPKNTQKHWAEVSRSKKAALASVGNGEEVINN